MKLEILVVKYSDILNNLLSRWSDELLSDIVLDIGLVRGFLLLGGLISLTVVVGEASTYETHNNEGKDVLVVLVLCFHIGFQADLLVVEHGTAGAAD